MLSFLTNKIREGTKMGHFEFGVRCCNNCIHWKCSSKREVRGNPPKEIYTSSNCDECSLSKRKTLSKNCCDGFAHLYGAIVTHPYQEDQHASGGVASALLDSVSESNRSFTQTVVDYLRESASVQTEVYEEKQSESENTHLDYWWIENGMSEDADKLEREWFRLTLNDAIEGSRSDQFSLGNAFYNGTSGVVQDRDKAVKWFRQAAENGLPEAQYMLAECYYYGRGVLEDEERAIVLYEKAANQGHKESIIRLAKMYYSKEHRNSEKAFKWAKLGTECEDYECEFILGKCYYFGIGTSEDNESAFKHFKAAAYHDIVGAGLFLATCYRKGYGTGISFSDACRWYSWEAKNGNAEAQFYYGKYLYMGRYGKENCLIATEWLLKAARGGYEAANELLGDLYLHSPVYLTSDKSDNAQALKYNEIAAENGYGEALFNLGLLYFNGDGVAEDNIKAVDLFSKAVNKGCERALVYLGICYQKGYGVEKDLVTAFEFYLRAAKTLDREAMYLCGSFKMAGKCTDPDYAEALIWYKKAAGLGDSDAMKAIGDAYLDGTGVSKDYGQALMWFVKAERNENKDADDAIQVTLNMIKTGVEEGVVECQNALGQALLYGYGIPENEPEAIKSFRMAADAGCADAMANLGLCYEKGYGGLEKNEEVAFEWYMKSAKLGSSRGELYVAQCYLNGKGVTKDNASALAWYKSSAMHGNSNAQNMVGRCLEMGWGTESDIDAAIEGYKIAALSGNVTSMKNLAFLYSRGKKVSENLTEAKRWYLMAAEYGSQDAFVSLSKFYRYGNGTPKDLARAFAWLVKGARYQMPQCEMEIADLYRYTSSVSSDEEVEFPIVVEWYTHAAEHKSSEAMRCLGDFYKRGSWSSPIDADEAFKWLAKAADAGDAKGIYLLGECYEKGIGCSKDAERAEELKKEGINKGYKPNSEW